MVKYLAKGENILDIVGKDVYLIDFYADWCGPCKMLAPILDGMEDINILKVNVDEFPDIAQKFGIMSIPTLIFFKEGLEKKKEIGFRTKEEIEEIVKNL